MPVKERILVKQIVDRVGPLVRPGTVVPRVATKDHDVSVVATALLRRAYLQAQAVLRLANLEAPDVGIPNLRSLFEAFGELHYLLEGSGTRERAMTAFIFAVQQMQDFQRRWGAGKADIEELSKELEKHRAAAPEAFDAASKRKNFWAPGTRPSLIDAAMEALPRSGTGPPPEELGTQLYKLLSWDDHHVMAIMNSVDLVSGSPTFGTIRSAHVMDDPEGFMLILAAMALEGMRRDYVRFFPECDDTLPAAT